MQMSSVICDLSYPCQVASKAFRISKEMNEEEIAKIKHERLMRKGLNSRAWHGKFARKGVSCMTLNSFIVFNRCSF